MVKPKLRSCFQKIAGDPHLPKSSPLRETLGLVNFISKTRTGLSSKAELGIFEDFWEGEGEPAKRRKVFLWEIIMVTLWTGPYYILFLFKIKLGCLHSTYY